MFRRGPVASQDTPCSTALRYFGSFRCSAATDSEILLRRDDQARFSVKARWICYEPIYMTGVAFNDWPDYYRRNGISARLVVRDADLREVVSRDIDLPQEAPEQDRPVGERSGDLDISVPAGPAGVYRLAVEASQPVRH